MRITLEPSGYRALMAVWLVALWASPAWAQHKLDWLNWADVHTVPYFGQTGNGPTDSGERPALSVLCDGNNRSGGRGAAGPETGSTIEFHFPEAVRVTELRLAQSDGDAFEITAATGDDGEFDAPVATLKIESKEGQDEQLVIVPVNKTARGLRIVATSGKPIYRKAYPEFREIEIYTNKPVRMAKAEIERGKTRLSTGKEVEFPTFDRRTIEFYPCIDLWMVTHYDMDKMTQEQMDAIGENDGFKRLVQKLKTIDAAGVRVFPETWCCNDKMPWKSGLCLNDGKEALRPLIAALHREGFKSQMFLHAWISPIQDRKNSAPLPWCRWDYPYEQSDFLASKGLADKFKVKYPCIISNPDFRDKWLGIMSEVVDRGIDGVFVLPDEYYYKGHHLPTADCPDCRGRFRERYGFEKMPGREEDTVGYRKWKLFEYERLAEMFNEVAAELKKKNPALELYCNPNLYTPSNMRLEHGIALDRMGAQDNFTGVMVYCGDPKRAAAAFPGKVLQGSIQCLNTFGAKDHSVVFHDYLMDLLMNGCTKINMYRLNYMDAYWPVVIQASKMARLLEQWDLAKSRVAAETCVLLSRASEDWWQVKADVEILDYINRKGGQILYSDIKDLSMVYGKEAKQEQDERVRHFQYERLRGMYSTQYVEDLLKRKGVQYDVRYSERPETLDNLGRYKLVILPFNYSMSVATFAAVKKAVEGGTKLLVYGPPAPTDEYGEPHAQPLLQSLAGHENVTMSDCDLLWDWSAQSVRKENLKLVRKLLASDHYFNANGANVRYWARQVERDAFILCLSNLDLEKGAAPVLGLPLPDGAYNLTLCIPRKQNDTDSVATYEGKVNHQTRIQAKDLKRLSIAMEPGELRLIRVQRQEP